MIRGILILVAIAFAACGIAEEADGSSRPKAAPGQPQWVDISSDFLRSIGADEVKTVYLRRCIGLVVTPAGDLVMQTATKGVCVSRDQGATWSVVDGNQVTGSCHTDSFSMAYPYDGRIAIFSMDGTGGISLDDGRTWRPFGRIHRNLQYADVDWSQREPQIIFGLTHEPWYTVLSSDGGRTWRHVIEGEDVKTPLYWLGLVDAKTLLRAHVARGGIEASTDTGRTWTRVADYSVTAPRPVHYGKNLYWGTSAGVIVSSDGIGWKLTGNGAADIYCGPYFGATEDEFMAVTKKAFVATRDGGKTWRELAPVFRGPGVFHPELHVQDFYGWDAQRRIIYAAGLSTQVYRLRLDD